MVLVRNLILRIRHLGCVIDRPPRNRYPGARFDSESYSYNFSFSQEILDEWNWTEHFAPQSETLRYAQFVTDKLNLRGDMQFNTRILSAHYSDDTRSWTLTDDEKRQYTCRFLITAMGILNQPTYPAIAGVHDFRGEAFHTARWPSNVSLAGKKVGIIGTGATGIQTIQEIVKEVGHLTVFQRTPNWSVPLRNSTITPTEMDEIRKQYPAIFEACSKSYACFIHNGDPRKTFDVPEPERLAFWDSLYAKPGFAKYLGNFGDIGLDRAANDAYSAYIADKTRSRINDPAVADKLIPKCHGFGTRRVPLESGYFEAYNRPNVRLVDVKHDDPIECITSKGIKTRNEHHDLDVIIYATGFDAVTGAFFAVDFRGTDNKTLPETWADGPQTQLGLTVKGFPNMGMIMGPHQMFGNIPRSIEFAVDWVSNCIAFCRENGVTRFEATDDGVARWTEHVHKVAEGRLANEVDSWMTGVNKNLAHKQKRTVARYNGPAPGYRKLAGEVAERGYVDFSME